jgi:hypothetical protein
MHDNKKIECELVSPNLIIAPQDPGSPPSWVPAFHGEKVIWVDRAIFNQLKKYRVNKPCHVCPNELRSNCKVLKTSALEQFKMSRDNDLSTLMNHFEHHGVPYYNRDALMADMLDDVIDVWLEDHKNPHCETCDGV